MTYDGAFAVGTAIEGTVKDAYTKLYDEKGNVLFSLQKESLWDKKTKEDTYYFTAFVSDQPSNGIEINQRAIKAIRRFTIVPVHLTDVVANIIAKLCAKRKYFAVGIYQTTVASYRGRKKRKFLTYEYGSFEEIKKKWLAKVKDPSKYTYVFYPVEAITPEYKKLADIINKDQVVYVNPRSVYWVASNTKNVYGGEIDAELAAAQKKKKIALTLLLAAGVTNMI